MINMETEISWNSRETFCIFLVVYYSIKRKFNRKKNIDTIGKVSLVPLNIPDSFNRLDFLHVPILMETYGKAQAIPIFPNPSSAPPKIVKHTLAICWQKQANCLSVFDHFVGLVFNGLIYPWADDPYFQMTSYWVLTGFKVFICSKSLKVKLRVIPEDKLQKYSLLFISIWLK